jgi:hypothetical protein
MGIRIFGNIWVIKILIIVLLIIRYVKHVCLDGARNWPSDKRSRPVFHVFPWLHLVGRDCFCNFLLTWRQSSRWANGLHIRTEPMEVVKAIPGPVWCKGYLGDICLILPGCLRGYRGSCICIWREFHDEYFFTAIRELCWVSLRWSICFRCLIRLTILHFWHM